MMLGVDLEERRRVFPDLKIPKPPQQIVKTYICRAPQPKPKAKS
jgi:hypothetical protein